MMMLLLIRSSGYVFVRPSLRISSPRRILSAVSTTNKNNATIRASSCSWQLPSVVVDGTATTAMLRHELVVQQQQPDSGYARLLRQKMRQGSWSGSDRWKCQSIAFRLSGISSYRQFSSPSSSTVFKSSSAATAATLPWGWITTQRGFYTSFHPRSHQNAQDQRSLSSSLMVPSSLSTSFWPRILSRWSSSSNNNNNNSNKSKTNSRWRQIAILLRYTRIPVLVMSVYSLGYQQGIIDCTKSPEALQNALLKNVLMSMGVSLDGDDKKKSRGQSNQKTSQVHIIHEADVVNKSAYYFGFLNWNGATTNHKSSLKNTSSSMLYYQVAVVGHEIVRSARSYVDEQLQDAIHACRNKIPQDVTDDQFQHYMEQDETIQFWYQARLRLRGETAAWKGIATRGSSTGSSMHPAKGSSSTSHDDDMSKPWQYVVIDTDQPNAFVTEILPQKFFITTAMLRVAETPDELAVVLGHEISHLILGHVSKSNAIETTLRTIEVLLLSMDPTEGVLTLAVIGGLATLRALLTATYSREHEREADEMGVVLAARACFDTTAGAVVMRKMHHLQVSAAMPDGHISTNHENENTSSSSLGAAAVRLLDSHPPSLERAERIQSLSQQENYTKYENSTCRGVRKQWLMDAQWGWNRAASPLYMPPKR